MPRHAGVLVSAIAFASAACHGSGPAGETAGDAGPSSVVSQQAGGATAWVRTTSGAGHDSARALAGVNGGRVVLAVARPFGTDASPAIVLFAIDAAGVVAWSSTFQAGCDLDLRPRGGTSSGNIAVLAKNACAGPVAGLGIAAIPASGSIVLLGPAGQFIGTVHTTGDLVDATVDDAGSIIVLASSAGSIFVASVAEDGTENWRSSVGPAEALSAVPGQGGAVVFASQPSRMVRLGPDGATLWTRGFPDGFEPRSHCVLTDGAIASLGLVSGPVSWGRGSAGVAAGQRPAVLITEPDGTPRTAAEIPSASDGGPPLVLSPAPHGRILVTGFGGCDRLRAFSPQIAAVWDRPLDPACASAAVSAATTSAGQIAVAGQIVGRADFGAGFVVQPSSGADAFVLAVWP